MYIIVGRDRVEKLKNNYTILPLDRVLVDGVEDRAYCVITNEQISFIEVPVLSQWVDLHNKLIEEYDNDNTKFCLDAMEHLYDKFGGEVNTFYDELRKRLNSDNPRHEV